MPLEVVDLRSEQGVPGSLVRRHGGWDAPELADAAAAVRRIVADVRRDGDAAVLGYTERFDGISLPPGRLRVGVDERDTAAARVDGALTAAMERAAESIRAFAVSQRPQDWALDRDGAVTGQVHRPIRRVGIYAPGGRGAYPSTVLMTAVPAAVAGVEQVVLCTPPDAETGAPADAILAAAAIAGIDEIYRVGGAQAIAAMAYGTDTIRACEKIVGPGNVYVTLAKREVYGSVGIDGLFGPSESLVVADDRATPSFAAAELLTQAEHDPEAAAILVTTSEAMLAGCLRELEEGMRVLPRAEGIRDALAAHGIAVLVRDLEQAAEVVDAIAPEHLCVQVADPEAFLSTVRSAGTALLGDLTAATLSDYVAGPSHVLPTARTARFSSGLGVRDFMVAINTVSYTLDAVRRDAPVTQAMAEAEDLQAHWEAVRLRLDGPS